MKLKEEHVLHLIQPSWEAGYPLLWLDPTRSAPSGHGGSPASPLQPQEEVWQRRREAQQGQGGSATTSQARAVAELQSGLAGFVSRCLHAFPPSAPLNGTGAQDFASEVADRRAEFLAGLLDTVQRVSLRAATACVLLRGLVDGCGGAHPITEVQSLYNRQTPQMPTTEHQHQQRPGQQRVQHKAEKSAAGDDALADCAGHRHGSAGGGRAPGTDAVEASWGAVASGSRDADVDPHHRQPPFSVKPSSQAASAKAAVLQLVALTLDPACARAAGPGFLSWMSDLAMAGSATSSKDVSGGRGSGGSCGTSEA
ncbi:hypothetical protein HaLaN_13689 [Haematococcus lacustris]|uniref:Uncharacterized protein n=1 Tax=Haematococcus lacustris TaxID=44745 RepID=A0A699Z3F0_HAELA|nr:hypothetical protein HaLaN_13689 [Haematococcus lacustris]